MPLVEEENLNPKPPNPKPKLARPRQEAYWDDVHWSTEEEYQAEIHEGFGY